MCQALRCVVVDYTFPTDALYDMKHLEIIKSSSATIDLMHGRCVVKSPCQRYRLTWYDRWPKLKELDWEADPPVGAVVDISDFAEFHTHIHTLRAETNRTRFTIGNGFANVRRLVCTDMKPFLQPLTDGMSRVIMTIHDILTYVSIVSTYRQCQIRI